MKRNQKYCTKCNDKRRIQNMSGKKVRTSEKEEVVELAKWTNQGREAPVVVKQRV